MKNFKSTTLNFMSSPNEEETFTPGEDENMEDYPEELRENVPRPESKTQRVQLLIKPSLYRRVKDEAAAEGVSVNELYGRAMRDYLRAAEKRKRKAQEGEQ